MKVDNASGKAVKAIKVVLMQQVKYNGTYTPPKEHKSTKVKKGKGKAKVVKKNSIRPVRGGKEIKKSEVRFLGK